MTAPVVVVIGGGLRGLSLVERLVAHARADATTSPLRIVVVDPFDPGAGRIWRVEQPSSLLMNTPASSSTVWVGEAVSCDGPRSHGPSFLQWLELVRAWLDGASTGQTVTPVEVPAVGERLAAALRADAALASAVRNLAADRFMPRALHGHYLAWAWREVVARAPHRLTIEHRRERAADLRRDGAGWLVELGGQALAADLVALCTGWPEGDASGLGPDSAIDLDHDRIGPRETVLLRGLGLGFFDSVTLLTHGRGGRFRERTDGRLVYEPSGAEPVIIATSRTGVPYRARASLTTVAQHPFLRRAIAERGSPAERKTRLIAAVRRDTSLAFYRTLATHEPSALRLPLTQIEHAIALLDPFGLEWTEFATVAHRDGYVFSIEAEAGRGTGTWTCPEDYRSWIRQRLHDDIVQTELADRSAAKVAAHVYGAARRLLVPLFEFDGLGVEGAAAHARYLSLAFAVTNGPPLVRIRELLALVDAGVVRLLGPDPKLRPFHDGFIATSERVAGSEIAVRHVLDARVADPGIGADPLARRLAAAGVIRPFHRRRGDGSTEPTSSVDTDPATGAAISCEGAVTPDLVVTGLLSLEARLHSLQAPAPGTDAPVFREQDAAARALLAGVQARQQREPVSTQ
ncbi:FAD/NAD(P)-binding protein [Microbacterium sp. BWT-B31]|uniref:FAD/NAD(P)-binding protein n=1 Tax=Microbacterium sp. BWT-B31 TaxID=3232072 RepID=UPI003529649C